MKSIICTLSGTPIPGDDVRLFHGHKTKGGRTDAGYVVQERDFWRRSLEGEDVSGKETCHMLTDESVPSLMVRRSAAEVRALVAEGIVRGIGQHWLGEMASAKAKGDMVVVAVSAIGDDSRFACHVIRDGRTITPETKGDGIWLDVVDMMMDDAPGVEFKASPPAMMNPGGSM